MAADPTRPTRPDRRAGDGADEPVVLRFWGPLDRLRAPAAGQVFRQVEANRQVIVDLERVTFVDSAGLRMLVGGILSVRGSGGRVILNAPSPWVVKVLRIVGVDRLAVIAPRGVEPAAV